MPHIKLPIDLWPPVTRRASVVSNFRGTGRTWSAGAIMACPNGEPTGDGSAARLAIDAFLFSWTFS